MYVQISTHSKLEQEHRCMADRTEKINEYLRKRIRYKFLTLIVFIALVTFDEIFSVYIYPYIDNIFTRELLDILIGVLACLSFLPALISLVYIKDDFKKKVPKKYMQPCDNYFTSYDNYDNYLSFLKKKLKENKYILEKKISTDEEKILYYIKNNDSTKYKFLIYKSFEYNIENFTKYYKFINKNVRDSEKIYLDVFGEPGYEYNNNSAYVEVNCIVLLIVDYINPVTLKLLEGDKETFVVLSVIELSNLNKLIIAEDNRMFKGNDYLMLKNELLQLLGVNDKQSKITTEKSDSHM